MSLLVATRNAQRMVDAGDHAEAERILADAAKSTPGEADLRTLDQYAKLCHQWGPRKAEEEALRSILRRRSSLDVLERLLDILQEGLNTNSDGSRRARVEECITLGTAALDLKTAKDLSWANLIHARGLRHLDMARLGNMSNLPRAKSDLDSFVRWLEGGVVPDHLQRDNILAFATVDLAELELLEGNRDAAASLLEEAIDYIESRKSGRWLLERAYALLEAADDGGRAIRMPTGDTP